MTTMAYIIAGVCVALAVAGVVWYAFMMKDDNSGAKDQSQEEE